MPGSGGLVVGPVAFIVEKISSLRRAKFITVRFVIINHMQTPVTHRINEKALQLLEQHPEGLRWSELLAKIKESDPTYHPKTVNGCVWKLTEKFPDKVYKPSRGLLRLLKYKT